jgi:hypothetical protein
MGLENLVCDYDSCGRLPQDLTDRMSTLVFLQGGRFTDKKGMAVIDVPKTGCGEALQWVVDAVNKHKIVSPGCIETGEFGPLSEALPQARLLVEPVLFDAAKIAVRDDSDNLAILHDRYMTTPGILHQA